MSSYVKYQLLYMLYRLYMISEEGGPGHESDGEDALDSNCNQRQNSASPYNHIEVGNGLAIMYLQKIEFIYKQSYSALSARYKNIVRILLSCVNVFLLSLFSL